jgi:hypothetical protein
MNQERLNDIVFWYNLGRQAFHAGVKLGAVRVPVLSLEWKSWREGFLHEYELAHK